MSTHKNELEYLFNPNSVAIIGASENLERIGGRPIKYLKASGYEGDIYPVNPKYEEIEGLKCYSHINEIDRSIDSVILSLPSQLVIKTLEDCGKKGVRSVIIFSSGFAETDEQGVSDQNEITKISTKYNMPILGPNCMGMINLNKGVYSTFPSAMSHGMIGKGGTIGFVSQSGAFVAHLYTSAYQKGIKLSYAITTGNEAGLDVADCITFLAQDPQTKVIAVYLEGSKDGNKLMKALHLARKNGKPVVVIKVGQSEVGRKAAMSHTATIVGSDQVYDEIFKMSGVYRAETIEELLDVSYASSILPIPKSNNVGIYTVSGGIGILMADQLTHGGLNVKEPNLQVQERLQKILPYSTVQNPFDTTAQITNTPEVMNEFLKEIFDLDLYDINIIYLAGLGLNPKKMEGIKEVKRNFPDIAIILVTFGDTKLKEEFTDLGFVVMDDPNQAVVVSKALVKLSGLSNRRDSIQIEWDKKTINIPKSTEVLTEDIGKGILKAYDIPVTVEGLANTLSEAEEITKEIGYPIVMKGMSPQIAHKSDMGLVQLNINNEEDMKAKYKDIVGKIKACKDVEFTGVLLQEMLDPAIAEVIVGAKNDPIFGPMVMVGIGGIYVEVFEDVSLRKAPIDKKEAKSMLKELRGYSLLDGVRGQEKADIRSLAVAISNLSKLVVDYSNEIEEVDINPIMVYGENKGVKAADALVRMKMKVT